MRVSKRLSWALRHDPTAAGLVLNEQGWVPVVEVLAALSLSRTVLDTVVASNDKRRFAVVRAADGVDRIRASQGHSVPVDLGLSPVAPPAVLFHGTAASNVDSIVAQGLRAGRRQHVHLSADQATALAVGRRWGVAAVVLMVDCEALVGAGHLFYRSANGVWLTDHVPAGYVSLVVGGVDPR